MINFKAGLLICCAATLVACGTKDVETPKEPSAPVTAGASEAVNTRDMSEYNKDLARFIGLEIGEPMDRSVKKIKAYLKPEGEGNVTGTWETRDTGEGVKTFTGLADYMADDSVKAQEITTIFVKSEDGSYRLTEYGARIKCWRGKDKDTWTTKLCP